MATYARRLLACCAVFSALLKGGISSTITLTSSENPSHFGDTITLTATVTPRAASGKVTLYDGVSVLGASSLVSGQATFTTVLLPSGLQNLRAHYSGDSNYAPSNSTVVVQNVVAQPSLMLYQGPNYSVASTEAGVACGDLNGDGNPDLIVLTPFSSGKSAAVLLGNGDGTFRVTTLNLGTWPFRIAVADFNGDGKQDVAFTDTFNVNTLDIALGNGDGTFESPLILSLNPVLNLADPMVGDFNGDGIADLAVSLGSSVGILLGNGNGTFQTIVTYPASNAYSIALGDFNGDGITDIVASGQNNSNLQTLLGNGDGTFQTAVNHPVSVLSGSIVVADFNGDGNADVAFSDTSTYKVDVLLGNGNGTFRLPATYGTGGPASLAVADVNGDGIPDLIAAGDYTPGQTNIFLGNGDGTFQAPAAYPGLGVGASFAPATGDFNGDSKTDLALGSDIWLGGAEPDLTVFMSHGPGFTQGQSGASYLVTVTNVGAYPAAGAVTLQVTLPTGITATAITGGGWSCALATLTCSRSDVLAAGTGYPGVTVTANVASTATGDVTASATVSGGGEINLSNDTASTAASIVAGVSVTLSSSPNPSALGETVNLAVMVNPPADGYVAFYGGATELGAVPVTGGQAALNTYTLPSGANNLTAEFSPTASYGASFSATLNQTVNAGSINREISASDPVDISPEYLAAGDFNLDGNLDLVTANVGTATGGAANGTISVLLGSSDGAFHPAATTPVGVIANTAVVADFNRDGKPDLALSSSTGLFVMTSNGDGTFQSPVLINSASLGNLIVADLNRDGIADLLVMGEGIGTSPGITAFLGKGDGTFGNPVFTPASGSLAIPGTSNWAVADLNGDGVPDLAIVNASYVGPVSVFLGNGDGTFSPSFNMTGLPQIPIAVISGDFNGDGKQDVALLFWVGASVLLGNGDGTLQAPLTSSFSFSADDTPGYSAIVGDFNGDGKLDLAYRSYYSSFVNIAFGDGSGLFSSGVTYSTDGNTGNLVTGDFNRDGKMDFAVVNYSADSVNVFLEKAVPG